MGYVYNIINLTTSIYSVINALRLFSRVKHIKINLHLFFAIKSYFFGVAVCHLFYSHLFLYNIYSLQFSTKHCNSEKFCVLWEVLQNVLFLFTNLSQGNFLCYQRFFIPTKILNTVRTPNGMKQNLLHWILFLSRFCQIIKHQSRRA